MADLRLNREIGDRFDVFRLVRIPTCPVIVAGRGVFLIRWALIRWALI